MFEEPDLSPKTAPKREQKIFLKRLSNYIDHEIHLKVAQDDMPLTYILKDVGKDYIEVAFGHVERIIPIEKILFFQITVPDEFNAVSL
jgi:hypothetical protein